MSIKLNLYVYTYNICICVCVCLPTEKFIHKDNKVFSTLMEVGLKSEKKNWEHFNNYNTFCISVTVLIFIIILL